MGTELNQPYATLEVYEVEGKFFVDLPNETNDGPALKTLGPVPMYANEPSPDRTPMCTIINDVVYDVKVIQKKDERDKNRIDLQRLSDSSWNSMYRKKDISEASMLAASTDHLAEFIHLWTSPGGEKLVDASLLRPHSTTWVHVAAEKNAYFIMAAFTFKGKDSEQLYVLNMQSNDGKRPLQLAAFHGHMSLVGMMLMCGGNPDKPDDRGRSALHYAVEGGRADIVKFLLKRGCSPGVLSTEHQTPLHIAVSQFKEDIVSAFVKSPRGSEIWNIEQPLGTATVLHAAIATGSVSLVRMIATSMRKHRDSCAMIRVALQHKDGADLTPEDLAAWYRSNERGRGDREKDKQNVEIIELVRSILSDSPLPSIRPSKTRDIEDAHSLSITEEKTSSLEYYVSSSEANSRTSSFTGPTVPSTTPPPQSTPQTATLSTSSKLETSNSTGSISANRYPEYIQRNLLVLKQLRIMIANEPPPGLKDVEKSLRTYILTIRDGRDKAWDYLTSDMKLGIVHTPALASILQQKREPDSRRYCGHWNSITGAGCPESNCQSIHKCCVCDEMTHDAPHCDKQISSQCEFPPRPCPLVAVLRESLNRLMLNRTGQDIPLSFEDVHAFALLPT